MDGFQRRREKKKENILRAAFELFSARGVQRTTMAEIAERAQVSQVTIYNYFGSKDGLLEASIIWYLEEMYEKYRRVVEVGSSFPEIIENLVFDKTTAIATMDQDFLKLFLSDDQGLREIVEVFYRDKSLPLMMTIIDKGREEGYIDENITDEALLLYIQIFKGATDRKGFFFEQSMSVQRDLIKLFFYGLMGKTPN